MHLQVDKRGIILSLHPGQFVSMASSCPKVLENSVRDLKYHRFIAENIGFKERNIHLILKHPSNDLQYGWKLGSSYDSFTHTL